MGASKGTIVDSGTTDTYLPSSMASVFKKKFKELTGIDYSNGNIALDAATIAKLPNIVFTLTDAKDDGTTFNVIMMWSSYTESVDGGKFAFRVYLTEANGAVLGANFMNGYAI